MTIGPIFLHYDVNDVNRNDVPHYVNFYGSLRSEVKKSYFAIVFITKCNQKFCYFWNCQSFVANNRWHYFDSWKTNVRTLLHILG